MHGARIKILFAFENTLPSPQADAEVFINTAQHLLPLVSHAWLHLPGRPDPHVLPPGLRLIRALAPTSPGIIRHLCCGLTIGLRRAFRRADLVYTRNLFVARMAILFGQRVAFDHYRPWPDQIPPVQRWLHRLMCHPRFVVNICHSDYTRDAYLRLGVPAAKLRRVHNGYDPERLRNRMDGAAARASLGLPADRMIVMYTGRLNHKKGLEQVIAAARTLPDVLFVLVGSAGAGPIEALAAGIANIRVVQWLPPDELAAYMFAADILLIPPSWRPLAEFGSTVLPLKLFLYMASGRAILAGDTWDVREVLRHRQNAFLCRPDDPASLVDAIIILCENATLRGELARQALADSTELSWAARGRRIADILAERLAAPAVVRGAWGADQRRTHARQSRRWWSHLFRTRSFVLPAEHWRGAPVTGG